MKKCAYCKYEAKVIKANAIPTCHEHSKEWNRNKQKIIKRLPLTFKEHMQQKDDEQTKNIDEIAKQSRKLIRQIIQQEGGETK